MAQDLAELIPRTRRAIEGPAGAAGLTDDQVKGLLADAVAEVVFFTGGVFGHQLLVEARDATTNAPTDWSIDPGLALDEETVVIAVAALNYFFHEFKDLKVREQIANEGASWEYALSANLVADQMKMLREMRDAALERVALTNPIGVAWVSYLSLRDVATMNALDPYLGGQAVA